MTFVKAMQVHVNYTSAELGYKKVKADLPIEEKLAKLEEKKEIEGGHYSCF